MSIVFAKTSPGGEVTDDHDAVMLFRYDVPMDWGSSTARCDMRPVAGQELEYEVQLVMFPWNRVGALEVRVATLSARFEPMKPAVTSQIFCNLPEPCLLA